MRLICPNCGAQYEVPANVIPEGGRDVQCSNCGHTWFQAHPDDDADLADELGRALPDTDWSPEPEPEPESDMTVEAPEPEPAREPEPEPDEEPAPQPAQRARGLDPSVAEVLREEAQREAARRAAEAGSLESQPELGLSEPAEDEAARRSREARERMSRMRGEEEEPEAQVDEAPETVAAAAAAGSRRELLPDIEEINQTLRASSERRSMETPQGRAAIEEEDDARRGGFTSGFRLVLGLAIFAVALYLAAPKLSEMMPGIAPALDGYVAQVDGLRLWLDGQVTALLQMLDGMSSEATGE
ncbi:zinc-ribbon domain-containing protein [Salipiger abyssi]|uniref:zinc-ribbon domain-containing protein n=1 Tax=Salipiger abyssi TaxID=1250539 RepID=UPI001A8C9F73|nr:zinc-ribbon domain-containing protein [Salipiger abyssi]MBN9889139.1 zinc-ribbon domain-containing protein [Salipiger abyssi]